MQLAGRRRPVEERYTDARPEREVGPVDAQRLGEFAERRVACAVRSSTSTASKEANDGFARLWCSST